MVFVLKYHICCVDVYGLNGMFLARFETLMVI